MRCTKPLRAGIRQAPRGAKKVSSPCYAPFREFISDFWIYRPGRSNICVSAICFPIVKFGDPASVER